MKTQDVEPRLLRVDEVAARLDLHPEVVRRKIRRLEIPAIRLGTGSRAPFRVPAGELDAWLYNYEYDTRAIPLAPSGSVGTARPGRRAEPSARTEDAP